MHICMYICIYVLYIHIYIHMSACLSNAYIEKAGFHAQLLFRNADYCILGRCLYAICHNSEAVHSVSMHQLLNG